MSEGSAARRGSPEPSAAFPLRRGVGKCAQSPWWWSASDGHAPCDAYSRAAAGGAPSERKIPLPAFSSTTPDSGVSASYSSWRSSVVRASLTFTLKYRGWPYGATIGAPRSGSVANFSTSKDDHSAVWMSAIALELTRRRTPSRCAAASSGHAPAAGVGATVSCQPPPPSAQKVPLNASGSVFTTHGGPSRAAVPFAAGGGGGDGRPLSAAP